MGPAPSYIGFFAPLDFGGASAGASTATTASVVSLASRARVNAARIAGRTACGIIDIASAAAHTTASTRIRVCDGGRRRRRRRGRRSGAGAGGAGVRGGGGMVGIADTITSGARGSRSRRELVDLGREPRIELPQGVRDAVVVPRRRLRPVIFPPLHGPERRARESGELLLVEAQSLASQHEQKRDRSRHGRGSPGGFRAREAALAGPEPCMAGRPRTPPPIVPCFPWTVEHYPPREPRLAGRILRTPPDRGPLAWCVRRIPPCRRCLAGRSVRAPPTALAMAGKSKRIPPRRAPMAGRIARVTPRQPAAGGAICARGGPLPSRPAK